VHLARRVDELRPDVHVFGHTHLGWDATIDGVRYLQAPLSYPEERKMRLGTVAISTTFPHGPRPTPLLVYDAATRCQPPRYDAGWSNFYAKYPRRPDLRHLLAPRAAKRYKPVAGVGKVGYLEEADHISRVSPAWTLGPPNAVARETNQNETY